MSTFGEAVEEIKKSKEILEGQLDETAQHPDPKKHFKLSMYKSAVRIAAGISLCLTDNTFIIVGGVLIIIAEIVGVLEEMV